MKQGEKKTQKSQCIKDHQLIAWLTGFIVVKTEFNSGCLDWLIDWLTAYPWLNIVMHSIDWPICEKKGNSHHLWIYSKTLKKWHFNCWFFTVREENYLKRTMELSWTMVKNSYRFSQTSHFDFHIPRDRRWMQSTAWQMVDWSRNERADWCTCEWIASRKARRIWRKNQSPSINQSIIQAFKQASNRKRNRTPN